MINSKKKTLKKVVLVTGGAKRIGQGICLQLAKAGFAVALHYHSSRKSAERTQALIVKQGGICELFLCNLENQSAVSNLIPRILSKFSRLDVVVNNASMFEKSKLDLNAIASIDKHFDINVKAPFILLASFHKHCQSGHVINILDTNIVQNASGHLTYLMSKKSLYELTKLSAVALAPRIRVNAVAPGFILPPEHQSMQKRDRIRNIPLKTKGTISQVVQSIKFLLENSYLTGQTIFIDGGQHLL